MPGQRFFIDRSGQNYNDDPSVIGVKRTTSPMLAEIKDGYNLTWERLGKLVGDFTEVKNSADFAPVKNTLNHRRMEIYLHEILTNGYTLLDGIQIAPSTEYAEYIAQYQGSRGDGLNAEISENAIPFETFFNEEAMDAWYAEHGTEQDVKYSVRLSSDEVSDIQSIGRKSVNEFTSADIRKTEKLAQRYYQEMGAKSPFFRAWFGDWRANDSTAVQIANQTGDARGEVTNADTGWTIRVSAKVFNETNAHKAKVNTGAMDYLPYINDIVRKAVLLDSYGIGKSKSVGSLLMHNLYAIVDDGSGATLLKLYVEEMNDINTEATGKRAYQLQNIEYQQPSVKFRRNP